MQKIREINFPKEDTFLKDITKITITFEDSPNLKNLNLCYKYVNTINMDNKEKLDRYVIFTTKFQMNMIKKCTQIFIDGTFKSSPWGFYQILNFSGFLPDINGIIPLFMVPMSGKSENLYKNVFSDIKKILKNAGILMENIPNKFMIDFEKPLQNAVKSKFHEAKVDGCYFYFIKLIWKQAKKFGLCSYSKLKITKILIFILKIIPFTPFDNREELFKKCEEYYNESEIGYKKLFSYYKKIGYIINIHIIVKFQT